MGNESKAVTNMKRLLCRFGKKLQFLVDVEEPPESELGKLIMRHDVIWYTQRANWYNKLIGIVLKRAEDYPSIVTDDYEEHLKKKQNINRMLQVAFEIEGAKCLTKNMKGCISNLSKYPNGVIIVKLEKSKRRYERVLLEFEKLHGPNNVIVVSFDDIYDLERMIDC